MLIQVFMMLALGGLVAWLVIATKQVQFKQIEYSTAVSDLAVLKSKDIQANTNLYNLID